MGVENLGVPGTQILRRLQQEAFEIDAHALDGLTKPVELRGLVLDLILRNVQAGEAEWQHGSYRYPWRYSNSAQRDLHVISFPRSRTLSVPAPPAWPDPHPGLRRYGHPGTCAAASVNSPTILFALTRWPFTLICVALKLENGLQSFAADGMEAHRIHDGHYFGQFGHPLIILISSISTVIMTALPTGWQACTNFAHNGLGQTRAGALLTPYVQSHRVGQTKNIVDSTRVFKKTSRRARHANARRDHGRRRYKSVPGKVLGARADVRRTMDIRSAYAGSSRCRSRTL